MFVELVIALMLLSLAVFVVPLAYKWLTTLCVVSLGVVSALWVAIDVFAHNGERFYDSGYNVVFGLQYGMSDPLSAFFMVMLSIAAVSVMIYARGYLKPYLEKNHRRRFRYTTSV
jgi:hydrogenase-4 component B